MDTVKCRLTVYFEEPFWVGIYERTTNGKLEVAKVVFGAEPKDYEIYEVFLKNWSKLRFSPPVVEKTGMERKINPKRMQRAIQSQLSQTGIGTKAQQALKLQHEQNKMERKSFNRQKAEEEKQRQFELHQQKKERKTQWQVKICLCVFCIPCRFAVVFFVYNKQVGYSRSAQTQR